MCLIKKKLKSLEKFCIIMLIKRVNLEKQLRSSNITE